MIWSLTKAIGSSTTTPAKGDCGPVGAGGGTEWADWPRAGSDAELTAMAKARATPGKAADREIPNCENLGFMGRLSLKQMDSSRPEKQPRKTNRSPLIWQF